MPDVKIYVRDLAYAKILKECGNDPQKIPQKIAALVNKTYGAN